MAAMGNYCKAYYVRDLRAFDGWTAGLRNAAPQSQGSEQAQADLGEDDHLFVQETFVVTRGIFIDEDVVFSDVTDAWKQFVKETLKFEPPVYETVMPEQAESSAGHEGTVA
jgi:hypothetical protein